METKFNFKSAICTSREQSERLLALGLKKETADMNYTRLSRRDSWTLFIGKPLGYEDIPTEYLLPAWSLHRLIEMMPTIIKRHQKVWTLSLNRAGVFYMKQDMVSIVEALADNLFDNIIGCIEWLIKEGYFPKEYLV